MTQPTFVQEVFLLDDETDIVIVEGAAVVLWPWLVPQIVSGTVSAFPFILYAFDVSVSGGTNGVLNLPAAPGLNQLFGVKALKGSFGANSITVNAPSGWQLECPAPGNVSPGLASSWVIGAGSMSPDPRYDAGTMILWQNMGVANVLSLFGT